MGEISISFRMRVFRTSQIPPGQDIRFASRKDYALRAPCNHRGKSARESVVGSMSSVMSTKQFCACLKCPSDVFLITSIITGRPWNIIHSQHPTGLCMPRGEPPKRPIFLSLKRLRILLDQEWEMWGLSLVYGVHPWCSRVVSHWTSAKPWTPP